MCTQNSTKNICFLFQKNGGGGDGGAGGSLEDDCGMAGMEMASLSSRYAFFENAKKKEEEEEKKKYMRRTPPKVWPITYLDFFIYMLGLKGVVLLVPFMYHWFNIKNKSS